jgi:N-dimethylarginine dimethylaminohydrolase
MDINNSVDRQKALHQWNQLEGTLRRLKVRVVIGKPRRDLPDMVFTANAGFFIKGSEIVVLSNFKHGERKGEEFWFEKFFNDEGYYVRKVDYNFEGAGDCLYFGDKPIGGYGFRTDKSAYETLAPGVVTCELVDSYFYHLDTCFCPLQGTDYLIHPGAFSSEALTKIRNLQGNELAVPEEEAQQFACNAVVIENNVIMPLGCPKTEDMLKQSGYTTFALDMSEFIKSGGACKCLTLKLT